MRSELRYSTHQAFWASGLFAVLLLLALASPVRAQGYHVESLVSDIPDTAPNFDSTLVNAWGLIATPKQLIVCATESSVARIYSRAGEPTDASIAVEENPTGVVMNDSGNGFTIPNNPNIKKRRQSTLIFVTEAGRILGWNPKVNLSSAIVTVDNSNADAVYKGVALVGTRRGAARLFAANFRAGTVEVYDEDWRPVGTFTDPNVDPGFAPFNVANIDGKLFVSFAKQLAPDNEDDEAGQGNGFVDEFDSDGTLVRRFAEHGVLNSPWAMVMAPKHFGQFSNALLIGNFGDGAINAFDPVTGNFLGALPDAQTNVIHIPGLWGLTFAKGGGGGKGDVLYYTSGPGQETHGVVGQITAIPAPRGGGGHGKSKVGNPLR